MLLETFSNKGTQKPNIDRESGRLNNVVIMTTDFNLNNNATFTRINQEELVLLGSEEKIFCYLGHSKRGLTSDDRLPFRLGYFENFSIDGSAVKADLVLSPTIEQNPILRSKIPGDMKEYIYSLAENESGECGFSMSVGLARNEVTGAVSIIRLTSVDLVEDPALTVAMFSKDSKEYTMEDIHPSLSTAFDLFNGLDYALKQELSPEDLINSLISTLQSFLTAPEEQTDPVSVDESVPAPEAPLEAPIETDVDPDAETVDPITALQNELAEVKALVMQLMTSGFSKEEKAEKPNEEKVEPVVFETSAPIVIESAEEERFDFAHFNKLKSERKHSDATIYWKRFH